MNRPPASAWHDLRAIVFDLDDTLYAQRDFKLSGFRAVAGWLAARGVTDDETAYRAMVEAMDAFGPSHPRLLNRALHALGAGDVDVTEAVTEFRRHRPTIGTFPGVATLLARLRSWYRIGLLTDGPAAVQRGKFIALGLEPYIEFALFSDELGSSKPDPLLYVQFERTFGLEGRQLAYLGDNPDKDFLGARQRGWRTIRVHSGEHAHRQPPSPGHASECSIDNLSALLPLLEPGSITAHGQGGVSS